MGLLDTLNALGIETPDDPMKQQALQRGLLSFGLGLMSSKGKLGPAMGQAGLLGMQAYGQDLATQQAQKGRDLQQQMLGLQAQQTQREMARQKALEDLPGQFYRSPAQQALSNGQGPTVANAQAMDSAQPQFDSAGYGKALMAIDPVQGLKWQQSTERPKTITLKDGETILDATSFQPLASGAPKLPDSVQAYQYAVNQGYKGSFEDWSIGQKTAGATVINTGQPVAGIDPVSGQPRLYQFGNKPGAAPINSGLAPMPDPLQISERKSQVERIRLAKTTRGEADEALALLDQAEKVVPSATGSLIGAGVDKALGAFGVATDGSLSAAKLKALEGALVAKMPKQPGPTSDKDMALYREAAGMIGNPTTPREQRLAAIATIRDIQSRYKQHAEATLEADAEPVGALGRPASRDKTPALASGTLSQAREAIAKGAPRAAVIQRLRDAGIDPSGL